MRDGNLMELWVTPHTHTHSGADLSSTLGGIIPHFFFGILKFWGDIQVLSIFQVLTILKYGGIFRF